MRRKIPNLFLDEIELKRRYGFRSDLNLKLEDFIFKQKDPNFGQKSVLKLKFKNIFHQKSPKIDDLFPNQRKSLIFFVLQKTHKKRGKDENFELE